MIVWVASYPRSGSNLTMLTVGRIFGFRKGLTSHPRKTLRRFSLPPTNELLPALTALDEPIFVKTHRMPSPDDAAPAIYLVRDGRDAVVSFAHYTRGRGQRGYANLEFADALHKIITRATPIGTWSDNVRAWTGRAAPTAVVRFESLIKNPAAAIGEAIDSLGLTPPKRRKNLPSFDELRARDPVMFRRGRTGTWREEMPPELEELFWKLHGPQMEALGYER
jgi:Sulfotransferase domain